MLFGSGALKRSCTGFKGFFYFSSDILNLDARHFTKLCFLLSVLHDIIIPVKAQIEWVSLKTKTKVITCRLDIPANLKTRVIA